MTQQKIKLTADRYEIKRVLGTLKFKKKKKKRAGTGAPPT